VDPRIHFKHVAHIFDATANDIEQNIEDGFVVDSIDFLVQETKTSVDCFHVHAGEMSRDTAQDDQHLGGIDEVE
jgi:hypothetical protein